jgi:CheY-like chemotaxis protein
MVSMEAGKRILVLDDDPIVVESVKRLLSAEGYAVMAVERGEEAVGMFSTDGFDLLITDIRLPDMNGLDVLREARERSPGMDVVIITGYPSLEDAREAERLGAFEYMEKPFQPEFLVNVAKRVFDKRGWILRRSYVERFGQYVVHASDMGEDTIFYKDGIWARPLENDVWEIGIDVRHWFLGGKILCLELLAREDVESGRPFARLLVEDGNVHEMNSPMSGAVTEVNTQVNDAMCLFARDSLNEGWMPWLVRIRPRGA